MKEHSSGIGHVANAIATGGAAIADRAFFHGLPVASAGVRVAKAIVQNIAGKDSKSDFGKFTSGLTNELTGKGTSKILKGYSIYKNKDITDYDKMKMLKQFGTDLINSSNGHVPSGYEASSAKTPAVAPVSTLIPAVAKPTTKGKRRTKKKTATKKTTTKKKSTK